MAMKTDAEGLAFIRHYGGVFPEQLEAAETAIYISVFAKLTQNQFNALASFAYSTSPESLRRSVLVRLLNRQEYAKAAEEFSKWAFNLEGKHDVRIEKRRLKERDLFLKGTK